ncbi:MAG: methylmalonyl-CoA mutase family protein [Alphaproteobacteria bacterium]|jgi:methylmalonyl-CoA mutase N-terminal domain/subunit|nr:methylmalonyl-CoA mutase family protein [Alphaproteobacteria bacterium]MDP6875114.1 methylmalonyl-CoA mutase family protein [Alphaproteobacteria bacterium]
MSVRYDRDKDNMVKLTTMSGMEVKSHYGPEDTKDLQYEMDLGDPGQFPFTRGIFPEMYRKRLWLRSQISCYAHPEETNKAFKTFIANGQTGLRILVDTTTHSSVDPDHPLGKYDISCNGNPTFAITEYRTMLDGIPLENVDLESACALAGGSYWTFLFIIALMEERGEDISKLRGTNINDPIHAAIVYGCPEFADKDWELARKINLDLIEFSAKHTPKWFPCTPCGYDMRDAGINAHQELAFCIANALQYYGDALNERGVRLEDLSPMAFSQSIDIDFCEAVAKFRALRRIWARLAKERLGVTDEKFMTARIGARISGASVSYVQKPINHTTRVALQSLAAVMGGAQSVDLAGIDEAFGLPSEEARIFGLDTQHIIAHETGAALVADPFGGSYYIESLTDQIEAGVMKLLDEIDGIGGMWECLKTGWLQSQFDQTMVATQKDIDEGKKYIVGVNAFKGENGPVSEQIRQSAYPVPPAEERQRAVRKVKALRQERDQGKLVAALTAMYEAERNGENSIRLGIEACKAYATVGELVGTLRLAHGFAYDHYKSIDTPDYLSHLEASRAA